MNKRIVSTEMNECFDMEVVLTGGKPGHFTSTLLCHIQHHPKPVGLAIEVTFKVRGVWNTTWRHHGWSESDVFVTVFFYHVALCFRGRVAQWMYPVWISVCYNWEMRAYPRSKLRTTVCWMPTGAYRSCPTAIRSQRDWYKNRII